MIEARVRKRDGRRVYDVRLRDDDGIEYSKTFLTKREAQEFEAAERTDRRRGEWIDPRLRAHPAERACRPLARLQPRQAAEDS